MSDRHQEPSVPFWEHGLEKEIIGMLDRLDRKVNLALQLLGVTITNQEHLDADVASLAADFATIIAELKAQPSAEQLDWTAADALVASVHTAANPAPVSDPVVTDPVVTDPSLAVDTSVASA